MGAFETVKREWKAKVFEGNPERIAGKLWSRFVTSSASQRIGTTIFLYGCNKTGHIAQFAKNVGEEEDVLSDGVHKYCGIISVERSMNVSAALPESVEVALVYSFVYDLL